MKKAWRKVPSRGSSLVLVVALSSSCAGRSARKDEPLTSGRGGESAAADVGGVGGATGHSGRNPGGSGGSEVGGAGRDGHAGTSSPGGASSGGTDFPGGGSAGAGGPGETAGTAGGGRRGNIFPGVGGADLAGAPGAAGADAAGDCEGQGWSSLWDAIRAASVGLGQCFILDPPPMGDSMDRRYGAVVIDEDGRVIDNTGLTGTEKQEWLDSLADQRWSCLAGRTIGYHCNPSE